MGQNVEQKIVEGREDDFAGGVTAHHKSGRTEGSFFMAETPDKNVDELAKKIANNPDVVKVEIHRKNG